MADMSWEHAAEARAALNAIVTDPEHGVAALSSPRTMSNLLKDLLPDAPREKNLLIAAAEAGLADTLNEHVALGMDASTAIRLTASSFSQRTPLTPDACSWVTGEIAVAMGISERNDQEAGARSQDRGGAGLPGSSDDRGRSWEQRDPSLPQDGVQSPGGGQSWAADSAPPAAAGLGPGSAVISPGQAAASSYRPAPGGQWSGGQAVGYQQAAPGYQQATPGYQQATPGSPAAGGYAPATPGYIPPTAFSPAQNPQAYGPGVAAGMPAIPGYQPIPQPGIARRTNTMAVTSLVLGMLQFVGWIFVLPGLLAAILAIVLGFVSMKQISRSGEAGRGLAITGVVLGFIGVLVVTILVAVGVESVNNQP